MTVAIIDKTTNPHVSSSERDLKPVCLVALLYQQALVLR
jgi:hypothetical protein